MLVIASNDDYIEEMLVALRAEALYLSSIVSSGAPTSHPSSSPRRGDHTPCAGDGHDGRFN